MRTNRNKHMLITTPCFFFYSMENVYSNVENYYLFISIHKYTYIENFLCSNVGDFMVISLVEQFFILTSQYIRSISPFQMQIMQRMITNSIQSDFHLLECRFGIPVTLRFTQITVYLSYQHPLIIVQLATKKKKLCFLCYFIFLFCSIYSASELNAHLFINRKKTFS